MMGWREDQQDHAERLAHRLRAQCVRRGLPHSGGELLGIAEALADAPADPLAGYRLCIFIRCGRECRGMRGLPCAPDCDIPF